VLLAGKGKEDGGTVWRLSGADEDGRGVLGSPVLGEQKPRTPGGAAGLGSFFQMGAPASG
jgi:hypothetical protein